MNKRRLHHYYRPVRAVKPRYILAAAVVSGCVSVGALRHNNQHMSTLRAAVYAADKDNSNVQVALHNLQAYVTTHMNTSLATGSGVYPPIQLQYTYERISEQRASALSTGSTSNVYTEAQDYCEGLFPNGTLRTGRVDCVENYISSHASNVSLPKPVDDSLYKFDFVAPRWSPDLAGWSLAATAALVLTAAVKLVVDWRLKKYLS